MADAKPFTCCHFFFPQDTDMFATLQKQNNRCSSARMKADQDWNIF